MKQGKLIRRAVSAALAGCMMFTLSAPALAASTDALLQQSTAAKSAVSVLDEENDMTAEPAYQMNLKNGSIEVYIENGKQYAKQGNNEAQQRGNLYITTDGGQTPNTLTIRGGDSTAAKVTLSNVNINASGAAVSVSGNVELVIEGTNTLHSGENHAGVEKADDNGTLTISGSGTLEASGGRGGAGIGSGSQKGCSNIVIESGTIIAHGGEWGAGIGSGNVGNRPGALGGSNITINDGDVTAYGGSEAAGIGGGFKGNGKDITINGGTVHAESGGGEKVAAIGGGRVDGKGENIQLTGGNVTVKSGTGVWIGGTNGEISKSSLTGAVTYQDGSGSVVDEVVQDYGLEVGAENSTQTRVTSKNYKDILDKGVLSYDPTTQTLKSNGKLPRSLQKINAPDKDIELKGENSSTVTDKLIVKNAHNVTISSDKFAAIFTRDDTSTINCTGKVAIRSNEDMAVNGSLNIDGSSEVTLSAGSSVVKNSANITSDGDVTIESTDGRAAEKLTINKAQNVTITISDDERAVSEDTKITASGTVILKNTAEGGPVGTVDFTQANGKAYVYYISDEPDAKLIDPRIHPLAEAAGESYLRIEPRETTYSITVANGTAQVGDDTTGQITTAFEGEKVTVKANAPTDEDAAKGVKFHHWKVEEGNISVDSTAGSLGSATEAGTEEISFDMPKGNVKLTAVYSIPASVLRNTVTVEGGKAKSTLGEGSGISAEIGTKVEISADTEEHPDKVFVKWEIVYPENFPENVPEELQLKLEEPNRAKTTFEMPAYPVKLIAHWSAIDPDESLDPGAGYDASSAAGGAIAAVAVGGAAIWGGYEITTRVILHNLLPEGAAIPANRGQLALLVWNTAGRPEPAGAPAFADVADPDMAKAAQWCTEQGIMDAKGDRFEPEGWTPKFKVIEVWNKAFPKQ